MSILDSGDEVIIPAPYWTTYPEAVKLAGGEPVFIKPDKKDNFKISVSDLEKAKNSKTKLLIGVLHQILRVWSIQKRNQRKYIIGYLKTIFGFYLMSYMST